jgi:hypothetical protein
VSGDLFGDRQIPNVNAKRPRAWPAPEPPGVVGLAVVALLAAAPAWFFGMSVATTALFAAACVATRAARNHRRTQQTLRVVAITVFLSYAQLTVVGAYPPAARLVFFGVLTSAAMWFYETIV